MTHDQFFKALKNNDIRPVYVFSGVEQHVKNSALSTLRAQLLPEGFEQLNESVFEGAVSAAEFILNKPAGLYNMNSIVTE